MGYILDYLIPSNLGMVMYDKVKSKWKHEEYSQVENPGNCFFTKSSQLLACFA